MKNYSRAKIDRAIEFAKKAHETQVRKYTGEPYFVHLEEVAKIVESVGGSEDMIIAAYLHDCVEDQNVTLYEIEQLFGPGVSSLVEQLTDISKPGDGNRAARKELDRLHTAKASQEGKTIKLADLISNTKSIVEHDPDFARVYLKEKERLLEVLKEGEPLLLKRAQESLIRGFLSLLGNKR